MHREFWFSRHPEVLDKINLQSDNYWLNTRTPCVTYGLRGLAYMFVEVTGPARDLHSGVFGRTVHEPMTDLAILLGKLVAPDGTILVPGVDEMVTAADIDERYEVNTQLPTIRS
jgi:Cys-Gly metallodipeptidase DUG1